MSQPQTQPKSGEVASSIGKNNFDFFRFWLAVLVIFAHSYALAEGDEQNEPFSILTKYQIGAGQIAVYCFFAISGYLISHSWLRSDSTISFLKKRALRIYPGFIVAVLIGLFVVAPLAMDHWTLTKRDLFSLPINLLTLRRVEPSGAFATNPIPGAINGSLWTIPYEFKCYLAVMVLGWFGLLTRHRYWLVVFLVGLVLGNLVYSQHPIPYLEGGWVSVCIGTATNWFKLMPYFLAGAICYVYRDRVRYTAGYGALALICLAVAALLPPAGHIVFPAAITYLLFLLSFQSTVRIHHWSRNGDFSYGIYLYAYPIQQLLMMRNPGMSPLTLFLIATPLSIVAGALSWHLIEKHALRLKGRSSRQLAKQPEPVLVSELETSQDRITNADGAGFECPGASN